MNMNESSAIRKLGIEHIDSILALWQQAELPYKPAGRDRRDRLEERITSGRDCFFGLFDDGMLAGVILATHDGRKGWVNRLAVDPAYRHRGLAQRLIARAEQHLRAEGIEIIAALIEGYNRASLELFQKCGYKVFEDIHYLTKRDRPDV